MLRALALAAALTLAGCGLLGGGAADVPTGGPPPPTPPDAVTLVGDAAMNAGGNAARVYLFPLASDATFRSTPVQAFWDDPEGVLGADLAGPVRDATVRPASSTAIEALDLGEAAYLGVAADLRLPDGDGWRALFPVSELAGKEVTVTVGEGGIVVALR